MYLYDNKVVFFCLLIQVIITFGFIIIQKLGYIRLVKESENIGYSKDKEMINISKYRKIVYNVDNCVDKYVNRFKFCGLKLSTISKICGYLMNFLFVTWSIAPIYGIYLECQIKEVLWTIMLGIFIVGGLFSVGWSVDNLRIEKEAKLNIKDYIENIIETKKRKGEITRSRKEHALSCINNIREKTVIDYEMNNKDVLFMDKRIDKQGDKQDDNSRQYFA